MKYAFQPWSFLMRMSAISRLMVGALIAVIIGFAYLYFFQYMNGGFWGDSVTSINNLVLIHILIFCWMYWWTLSMDN
jgi:hypothetical protein